MKCDGVQPCSKCRKSEIECVFAKLPPKRGPPKQYIELLEARLQLVEKALQSIDGPARRILDNALLGSVGGNNENTATRQGEGDGSFIVHCWRIYVLILVCYRREYNHTNHIITNPNIYSNGILQQQQQQHHRPIWYQ